MRFSRSMLMGAVAALAVTGGASLAGATPVGSIGYTALGGASADTTDLATATSVSIAGAFETTGPGQGDLSVIAPGTPLTITPTTFSVTPLDTPEATSLTLDVHGDVFTFDEQEVTVHHSTGSGPDEHSTLTIDFTGSVTGPDITSTTDTASATFTFDQTGGAGSTISFAGTAAHPAVPIGLLGLGLTRRRR